MCGYVGRKFKVPEEQIHHWREYAELLRIPLVQYYVRQSVDHLVTMQDDKPQLSTAVWWYMLKREGGQFKINEKVTSFNARNLDAPMWRKAIRQRRAVLFATEIGESMGAKRYLMQSNLLFPLGCVYQDWSTNGEAMRSFAVITREPHPRFGLFHNKSMPLFLPSEPEVLNEWLNPQIEESPLITELLEHPKLSVTFKVTPVKTYKRGEPLGDTELLEKDEE